MSLTNPNKVITEERLSEFYQGILPYLGGMPEALANKFNKSDLYSTDEKIVGCWTDGKPVYQKVISSTSPTSDDVKYISVGTGISVDKFISINAMLYDGAGNIPFSGVSAAEISFGATLTGIRVTAFNNIDGVYPNTVGIKTNVSWWQGDPIIVIVKYTKTTDAANSFKYGSETDYSTTEKIVGTWIDGKPLYQKTFTGTKTISTSESTLGVSLDSTCDITDWKGVVIGNASNKRLYKFGYFNTAANISGGSIISAYPENNIFYVRATASFTDATYWLTVQYTKTTD